jgi:hypothetical protein
MALMSDSLHIILWFIYIYIAFKPENDICRTSDVNLGHFGADLSILRCNNASLGVIERPNCQPLSLDWQPVGMIMSQMAQIK